MRTSFFFLSFALNLAVFAQPFTITGTLTDEQGKALEFANVVLLRAADSSFVSGTVSEVEGGFTLTTDLADTYQLLASSIGYADVRSAIFQLNTDQPTYEVGALRLGNGAVNLATATITASRPLYTRQIDRTIVNVADQPTALGQTALEVLERAPGVFVDRTAGGIRMLGKDGVQVMINGRLNYMPADALLAFLAGIPASDIIRLELITTPPADLDAEGNAGYIDIVLRRLPDEGLRGTYALTAGYGGGEVLNANTSATYRKGKVSAFGNLSFLHNAVPEFSELNRQFVDVSGQLSTTELDFERDPVRSVFNARVGLDLQLSDRTIFGVLAGGYLNHYQLSGLQTNRFRTVGFVDTLLLTDVTENNDWSHLQTGLSVRHQLSNQGALEAGLDYLYYTNSNPIDYTLRFSDAEQTQLIRRQDLTSRKDSPFGIVVGKIDYRRPLGKGRFSMGAKAVIADFENKVSLFRDTTLDPEFSSQSELGEYILAAYTQYRGELSEHLRYQVGLRYEHTDSELTERTAGPLVDRNYGSLFPSASLGYQVAEAQQLTAGYSRRINRPAFTQLAPFVVFLDPRTNFGGNPALQPAISNNLEVGYQYNNYGLTLSYTQIDDAIAAFQDRPDPESARQIIQPVNLAGSRIYAASLAIPTAFTAWWRGRLNVTYTHQQTDSQIADESVERTANILQLAGGQNFTLTKSIRLSASGFFRSRALNGFVRTRAVGSLNLALQYELANGATLTAGLDDALNTLDFRNESEIPVLQFSSFRRFDPSRPTFKITYSHSFGNSRVKSLDRDSATEERGRVN